MVDIAFLENRNESDEFYVDPGAIAFYKELMAIAPKEAAADFGPMLGQERDVRMEWDRHGCSYVVELKPDRRIRVCYPGEAENDDWSCWIGADVSDGLRRVVEFWRTGKLSALDHGDMLEVDANEYEVRSC